jgi:hypothetical protein
MLDALERRSARSGVMPVLAVRNRIRITRCRIPEFDTKTPNFAIFGMASQ